MKNVKLAIATASLLLSACSSQTTRQADGGFDYVKSKPVQAITVAGDLKQPKKDNQYDIPSDVQAGTVGSRLSILPPRLLIPLIQGTHVDEHDPKTTIWFEQSEEIDNLEDAIWQAIEGNANKHQFKLSTLDKDKGYAETQWVPHYVESGWWFWSARTKDESRRYSFTVKMKPHGRTGTVTVALLDHRIESRFNKAELDQDDFTSLATGMLNQVVGHFDYQMREEAEQRKVIYSQAVVLSYQQTEKGDPAMLVDAPFAHTWLRTLNALTKLGFTLTDLNKIEGRAYLRYRKDDGVWSSIFGDGDQAELKIENGDYVVEFARMGDKTQVMLSNNNLDLVSEEAVKSLVSPLQAILAEKM